MISLEVCMEPERRSSNGLMCLCATVVPAMTVTPDSLTFYMDSAMDTEHLLFV